MELSFWQIFWLIITFFLWIIAVKITFTFDINKHREQKQKRLEAKLINYCPHMKFTNYEWKLWIRSTFVSPSWTFSYQCQKCWLVRDVIDEQDELSRQGYYVQNPKELEKQEKKFQRLLKKAWYL